MKKQLKCIVASTSLGLLAVAGFAQTDTGNQPINTDTNVTTQTRENRTPTQFCHAREILGASVRDSQGEKLGDIHDVLFNSQKGEAFAAINVGHSTYALVPTQMLNVTPGTGLLSRKADVTLNSTRKNLESGPTIKNDEWDRLDTPSFTQQIYSYYKVQAPNGVGGVGPNSLGGTETGTEQGTNTTHYPHQRQQ